MPFSNAGYSVNAAPKPFKTRTEGRQRRPQPSTCVYQILKEPRSSVKNPDRFRSFVFSKNLTLLGRRSSVTRASFHGDAVDRSKIFAQSASSQMRVSSSGDAEGWQGPDVSIIVHVFNEIQRVPLLVEGITNAMRDQRFRYEIICVDDGSTDGSAALLAALASETDGLSAIILRRNFGAAAALQAGFDHSRGQVIVTLEADLRNDPKDIPALLERLLEGGYDLVCGQRSTPQELSTLQQWCAGVASWMLSVVTGVESKYDRSTFKAWKSSLEALVRPFGDLHTLLAAGAQLEGASVAAVTVEEREQPVRTERGLWGAWQALRLLCTVAFLSRFRHNPTSFIKLLAAPILLLTCAVAASAAFTIYWHSYLGLLNAAQIAMPQLVLTLELLIAGVQLLCFGIVADMLPWNFFGMQRHMYRIRHIVGSANSRNAVNGDAARNGQQSAWEMQYAAVEGVDRGAPPYAVDNLFI
ncbi:hypothetical protein CYMTET_30387 [Cymbomonas tetramitiformis]|uniref:Glycosyltransferase 2-like domain-containing protein n=1 Tax=Cymbomonas tetramitiformis TaxID=36881 RepID=A0AAE0FIY5_9CHLO|nr:hypothetical protein CYMTET_30387 [Cymbomonas tetramitiformis]